MHLMILLCVLATLLSMLFLIFFLVCLSSRLPSSFLFRPHVAIASAFIFPLAFAFSLPSLFLTGILTAGHWLTSVIPSHRSVCAQVVAGVASTLTFRISAFARFQSKASVSLTSAIVRTGDLTRI